MYSSANTESEIPDYYVEETDNSAYIVRRVKDEFYYADIDGDSHEEMYFIFEDAVARCRALNEQAALARK